METLRGEQKNVTSFCGHFLFYRYDFSVGLLQGFMINAHESGSNSPMVGTFSADVTKQSPAIPKPLGGGIVAKDWCITHK